MTSADQSAELTFRRVHNAPPDLLFACMTLPEHLTHFWGPTGTTTPEDRITVHLRPGGIFETVMVNDLDGSEYTMRAVYTEVEQPSRLAWIEQTSGMQTTITFVNLGDGRTEVVTHQTNVPDAYRSPEAQTGFLSSLDRCDAYVAELVGRR